eukprot:262733_1
MSLETVFVVSYILIHLSKPTLLKGICGSNTNFTKWQQISPPTDKYTLIQSNIYMRHGDRTQNHPIQCFNDIQPAFYCEQTIDIQSSDIKSFKYEIKSINGSNIIPGTCLIGQLTSTGYNQCFSIGQHIKQRYSNHYKLLPISINSNNKRIPIYLGADTMSRVQLSLMAFFDGLYENNIDANKAIPLFNVDIVPSDIVCPYLSTIRQSLNKNSNLYKNYHNNITLPLLSRFNAIMSSQFTMQDMHIATIFDCGNVFACSNKHVPYNYTQQLFDEIIEIRSWNAWFHANHPNYIDATKYNCGPLLASIFGEIYNGLMCDMDMYNNVCKDNYKLFMYGGHDSGVIALLGALEVDMRTIKQKWIPYASFVSFELFKNNKNHKYYVLMSYNGKLLSPSMCDCDKNEYYLCEWNKFKHFMLTITPKQYECPGMKNNMFEKYNQSNLQLNEYTIGNKNKFYIIPGMAFMVLVFVMLVVIGILYTKQQPDTIMRYHHQNDCSN